MYEPQRSDGPFLSAGEEVNKLLCPLPAGRRKHEEAAKVDVEKQKGGKEADGEPAMMGECFEIKALS